MRGPSPPGGCMWLALSDVLDWFEFHSDWAPGALKGTRDDVNKSVEVWWDRMGSYRSGAVIAVTDSLESAQDRLDHASARKRRKAAEYASTRADRGGSAEVQANGAAGEASESAGDPSKAAELARSVAEHEDAVAAVEELAKQPLNTRVTITIEYADTRERCHHPLRELQALSMRIAFDLTQFVPEQPPPGSYSHGRIVEDPDLAPLPENSREFVPLDSKRPQVAAARKSIGGLLGAHPRDYHVAITRLGESRVDLVNEAALCGALHGVLWRLAAGTVQADPSRAGEWTAAAGCTSPAPGLAAGSAPAAPLAGGAAAAAAAAEAATHGGVRAPRVPVPLWFMCAAMDLFAGLSGTARPLVVHRLGAAIAAAATCAVREAAADGYSSLSLGRVEALCHDVADMRLRTSTALSLVDVGAALPRPRPTVRLFPDKMLQEPPVGSEPPLAGSLDELVEARRLAQEAAAAQQQAASAPPACASDGDAAAAPGEEQPDEGTSGPAEDSEPGAKLASSPAAHDTPPSEKSQPRTDASDEAVSSPKTTGSVASSPRAADGAEVMQRLIRAADELDEAVLRAPRLQRSEAAAWQGRAELELWGRLLRSHQLDKKVMALDRIKAGVAIVADSPHNVSGGLSAPDMAEWLCDRQILSAIFGAATDAAPANPGAGATLAAGEPSISTPRASSGGSAHSEVVQRAGPILAFLAAHARITPSDLRVAWHAAAGRHAATERSILVTLVNLTSSLSPAMRQELAGVISSTPFSAWTERVVATVRDFTLEAAFAEMNEATQLLEGASTPPRRPARLPNGADLLWQFVQDRGGDDAASEGGAGAAATSARAGAAAFDPARGCRPPTERLFLAAVDAFVELLARLRTGAAAQLALAEEEQATVSRQQADAASVRVRTLEAFAKQAEDLTGHFVDRCLLCISGSAGSAGQSVIILRRVLASLPRAAKPKGWLRGKGKTFGRTLDSELLRLDAVPRSRAGASGTGSLLDVLLDDVLSYSAAIRSVSAYQAERHAEAMSSEQEQGGQATSGDHDADAPPSASFGAAGLARDARLERAMTDDSVALAESQGFAAGADRDFDRAAGTADTQGPLGRDPGAITKSLSDADLRLPDSPVPHALQLQARLDLLEFVLNSGTLALEDGSALVRRFADVLWHCCVSEAVGPSSLETALGWIARAVSPGRDGKPAALPLGMARQLLARMCSWILGASGEGAAGHRKARSAAGLPAASSRRGRQASAATGPPALAAAPGPAASGAHTRFASTSAAGGAGEGRSRVHTGLGSFGEAVFRLTPTGFRAFAQLLALVAAHDGNVSVKPIRQPPAGFKWKPSLDSMAGGAAATQAKAAAETDEAIARAALQDTRDAERVVVGGMVVALDPAENAWACCARQAWSSTFGSGSGSSSVLARPRAPPASRPVTGALKRQALSDFPGINALWVLAVHATDATVGRAATGMLVTLHTALSHSTIGKGAALRRAFVVKALRYVESAVELRRGVLEGTYSANAVPAPRRSGSSGGGSGSGSGAGGSSSSSTKGGLGASGSQADSKSGVVPPTPPLGAMRSAPRRHGSQATKAEPGAPTPEPDAEALAWQEGELARQRAMHRWSVSSLPGVVRAVAAMRELLQGVIGQNAASAPADAAGASAASAAAAGAGGGSAGGVSAATSGSDWADALTDLSGRDSAAELGEPVGNRRVIVVCDPLPPPVLGSAPGKARHWNCRLTAKLTPAMLIRRVARFSGWAPESIVLRLESDGPSSTAGRLLFSMVTPLVEEAGRSTEDVQITALHKRGMGAGDVRTAGSSLEGSVGAGEAELERWGLHARPGSSAREDGWWREPDSTLASAPLRADSRALPPSALVSGLFGHPRRAVDLAGGLEPPNTVASADSEQLSSTVAPELACGALVSARPRLAHDFDPWSNPWAVGADLPPAKADAAMLALVPHTANATQLSRGNVPSTQLGLSVQGLNLVGSDARAFEQLSSMSLVEGDLARQAFAQLFALLSMVPAGICATPASRPSDSDAIEWAAAAAWETIQLLPTNPQTMQAIRLANRGGSSPGWAELLHPLTTGSGATATAESSWADEGASALSGRGEAASRDFAPVSALPAAPPSLFGLLYTLQAVDVFVHGAKPAGMTQTQFDRRIRSQMCDGVPQGTLIRFNFCSDMVRLGGTRALEQLALRTKFSGPAGPACAAMVLRILHTLLSLDPSFSPVDIVPSTTDEAADARASAGAAAGDVSDGADVWEHQPVQGPLGTGGVEGAARALGRPRAAWAMRSVTNYSPGMVLRHVSLPGLCTAVVEQMLHRGRQRAADRRAWSVGGARGPIPGSAHSGWSGCGTAIQGMQLLVSCIATDPAACIPALLGHRALTPWLRHFCLAAASPERFAVCQGLLRISSFLPATLSFPGLKAAAAGAGIGVPGPAAVLLGMLVPMLPSAHATQSRSVQRRCGHLYSLVAGLAADASKTELEAALADIPAVPEAVARGSSPTASGPARSRGSGPHVRERVSHTSTSSPKSTEDEADELAERAAARCVEAAQTFKGMGWLFRRLMGQILSTSSHESAHAGEIGADHCLRGAMRAARIVARVAPLVRRTPVAARAIPFLVHAVLFPAPSAAEELPPLQPLPGSSSADKTEGATLDGLTAPPSPSDPPVKPSASTDAAHASTDVPSNDAPEPGSTDKVEKVKDPLSGLLTPPRHGASTSVSGLATTATPGLPFTLDDSSVNGDAVAGGQAEEDEEEDADWEQAASASARFGPLAVTPGTRSVAYALVLELVAPDPELEPLECDEADNLDSWLPPALVAEDPSALLTGGWSRPRSGRAGASAAAALDGGAYVSGPQRPRLPVLATLAPAPGPLASLRPAPAQDREDCDFARALAASAAEAGEPAEAPALAPAGTTLLDRFEQGGLGPADRSRLLLQCVDDAWRSGGVVMGVGDGETGDAMQAERWFVDPTQVQRSGRPFVGLQNLGATCYMNSTLQQLFCAPTFREALLHAPLPEPGRQHTEVLQSLQELIGFLALSQRRWADTAGFASAFKELDGSPLRRGEHKDALEFLTLLFERLEAASPAMGDVVKRTFGGTVVSQIISLETPYVSQREDPFTLLSLEVEGHGSIQRALEAFGEGEILSGDNRYRLPDDRSVEAKKRSLPRDLPPRLMLHLNRLKFDLATLSRKKVNDYVAFPPRLDMRPYCLEGVQERERAEGVAVGPEPVDGDTSAAVPARPAWYYQYELTGVVLHVGSANAGHYFSFVKGSRLSGVEGRTAGAPQQAAGASAAPSVPGATDPAANGTGPATASEFGDDWWELNDRLVRPIDPSRIPELCFGGFEDDVATAAPAAGATAATHSHASSAATAEAALPKSQRQRILNAYILIYERVAAPEPPSAPGAGLGYSVPQGGAGDDAALARAASADTVGRQSDAHGRSREGSLAGWLGASLGPEDTPHLAALPTPALVSGGMGPLDGGRGRPMSKTDGGDSGSQAQRVAASSAPASDDDGGAEQGEEDPRSAMRELDLGSPAMEQAKSQASEQRACTTGDGGASRPPLLRATSQGTRPKRQLPDHVTQAVWAASREFVITSLTFSPDFTAFVWALASLPAELQQAARARAESIRRHEARRLTGPAGTVAAQLDKWSAPPDVRAGALSVGFRGWLDVVSRASPQLARKMGSRAWLPALRLAMDTSPTAARSLVSRLALDSAARRRAVLHCPHAHQRKAAAGLMLRAFRAGADRDGTDSYLTGVSALDGFGVAAGADVADAAEADSLSESVESSTREALSSPAGAFVRSLLSDIVAALGDATKVPRLGEVLLLLRGVATTGPLERGLLATAGFVRAASVLLGAQLESLEMLRLDPYEQPVLAAKPEMVECPSRSQVAEALSLVVRSCNVTAADDAGAHGGAGVAAAGSPLSSSPGELALIPQGFLHPATQSRLLANMLYYHTAAGIPMVQHLCWSSVRLTHVIMRFLDAELAALAKITLDGAADARTRPLIRTWAGILSIQDGLTETRLHGMGGLERLVSTGTQLNRSYGRRGSVARALAYLSTALIEIACSGPVGRRAVLDSRPEWTLWAKLA